MRRLLGTLAVLLALAGCGDESSRESPPAAPDVLLVHATAGGGSVEKQATDVTDDADLAAYVAQFDDGLAQQVSEAAREVGGDTVLAQVVSVGCDVPPTAHLEGGAIVPAAVPRPTPECFAPVTTVALAST